MSTLDLAVGGRMAGADFLKLRKRRGVVIWALVLAVAPPLLFFIVTAVQHASNPARYEPAGGMHAYHDGLRVVAMLFAPLAAILIGTEAGVADSASGVFRDLVATGRSRIALFAARVPAALLLSSLVACASYAVLVAGTFAFASNLPTPSGSLLLNGLGFTLLSTGVICTVAVGFSSLTASRPAALTVLIGWHLIASPLLAGIDLLGSSRELILSEGVGHFSPIGLGGGPHGVAVTMGQGTALAVIVGWLVVFLALGAWRTRTMDA